MAIRAESDVAVLVLSQHIDPRIRRPTPYNTYPKGTVYLLKDRLGDIAVLLERVGFQRVELRLGRQGEVRNLRRCGGGRESEGTYGGIG